MRQAIAGWATKPVRSSAINFITTVKSKTSIRKFNKEKIEFIHAFCTAQKKNCPVWPTVKTEAFSIE